MSGSIRCTSGGSGEDGLWERCHEYSSPNVGSYGWIMDSFLDRCMMHLHMRPDGHLNIITEFKDIAISDMLAIRRRMMDDEDWVDEDTLFAQVVARMISLNKQRAAAMSDIEDRRKDNFVIAELRLYDTELFKGYQASGISKRGRYSRDRQTIDRALSWFRSRKDLD